MMETKRRVTLSEQQYLRIVKYLSEHRDDCIQTELCHSVSDNDDPEVLAGYELASAYITDILLALQKADQFTCTSDDILEYVTLLKKEYWKTDKCPVCEQVSLLRYLHGSSSLPSVKICNSCADELSKQLDEAHDAIEHTYKLSNKQVFAIKQTVEHISASHRSDAFMNVMSAIDWDMVCTQDERAD